MNCVETLVLWVNVHAEFGYLFGSGGYGSDCGLIYLLLIEAVAKNRKPTKEYHKIQTNTVLTYRNLLYALDLV